MMVDGAEESQLKGPIDVLAPYSSGPSDQPGSGDAVEARHRMSISTIQGAQASFWTRHRPRRLDIIRTCEYKCE
jgi:hypothetical protein